MFSFTSIVVGATFAVTLVQSQSEELIIAGKKIHIEEAPFMVGVTTNLLAPKGSFMACGGSLVTVNHVITAGHCTTGNATDMRVYMGSEDFSYPYFTNNSAVEYRVKAYQRHPQYQSDLKLDGGTYVLYDVSVVRLATPAKLGPQVAAIRIVTSNQQPPAGAKMTVSGWGVYKLKHEIYSQKLRSASLSVLTSDQCRKAIKYALTPEEFCTEASRRGAVCFGDSGSPAYIRNIQYGVVSWSNCGTGLTPVAVYTKLAEPSVNSFVMKMVATL